MSYEIVINNLANVFHENWRQGNHIHEEWIKRNRDSIENDPSRQHLLKPFSDLDKEEQEKDLE